MSENSSDVLSKTAKIFTIITGIISLLGFLGAVLKNNIPLAISIAIISLLGYLVYVHVIQVKISKENITGLRPKFSKKVRIIAASCILLILIVLNFLQLFPPTAFYIYNFFWSNTEFKKEYQFVYLGSKRITPATTVTIAHPFTTPTTSPTITNTLTISPTLTDTITITPTPDPYAIAITEIMANPEGVMYKNQNEYIELYNYGNSEIDVNGWFISTTMQDGTPDEIVSWKERNIKISDISQPNLTIDSTIIPPHHFAVILCPIYSYSWDSPKEPYQFPNGTIVLTIRKGGILGNKDYGIRGAENTKELDGIFIYEGSQNSIRKMISTYGVIIHGTSIYSPVEFRSGLPLGAKKGYSVQRKFADGKDILNNWEFVKDGNPGSGPY